MIVLDSSAAVDYLLARTHGVWVEERLRQAGHVHAPHLLDIEVMGAVRRRVLLGVLPPRRAHEALNDLRALDVTRYPHLPLLPRMWELRDILTASDAAFVALAEALGVPLVTTDLSLAASSGPRIPIVAPM